MSRVRALDDDRGSIFPLLTGLVAIALMLTLAAVAASTAFLRQRDLASICDGAAIAGAQGADLASIYTGGLGEVLPLDETSVAAEVASYMALVPAGQRPGWGTGVVGRRVTVTCARTVHLPFGTLVGRGGGWDQRAVAVAEAPVAPSP